jgi:hypothetical protein
MPWPGLVPAIHVYFALHERDLPQAQRPCNRACSAAENSAALNRSDGCNPEPTAASLRSSWTTKVIGFGIQVRETGREDFHARLYICEGRRRRLFIGGFHVAARE